MLFENLNEIKVCEECGNERSECCCDELAFTVVDGQVYTKNRRPAPRSCDECDLYCCTECTRYNNN